MQMRSIGYTLGQTIAGTGLLATLLLAPVSLQAQEEETPGITGGTGEKAPDNESLIEKSKKSSVKADAIWIEITKVGRSASRWVLDLNRKGSCYVLRDEAGSRTIYGGSGMSPELVKRAFDTLTKRNIIYGSRGKSDLPANQRELVGIGMATWDGSRVYKTQSGSLDTYPEEVQKLIGELRKSAEQFPVSPQSMGSIQSTFLRPDEARRMLKDGKRLVTVDDPGRDAKQLSTLEMAVRLPGRDIVVPSGEDWVTLLTYVRASNPMQPDSGEFFVKSSSRVYRVIMQEASAAPGLQPPSDDPVIPKAKPVER